MSKALIIIDMWDKRHPGEDRFASSLEQSSLKLKMMMRRNKDYVINIPIVVATYNIPNGSNTNQTILSGLDGSENELVSWDKDEVMKFLNSRGVTDLYFAGISFPGCIRSRPLGIDNMKDDFDCHVIIDCVLNTLGTAYTEYDIIHETYHNVLSSGLSYIYSTELLTND